MTIEQRIIMNMYNKNFKYSEIIAFLGRSGIKYNGRYLGDLNSISSIVEKIVREHSIEIDYL